MNFPGIMHVKADLLDSICNVRSGECQVSDECQVLKSTGKAAVCSGVSNGRTGISRNFGTCIDRSGTRLAVAHPVASKNVQNVLSL